ncbi:hypothetical protein [Streptosporangium sp. NPDC003464]
MFFAGSYGQAAEVGRAIIAENYAAYVAEYTDCYNCAYRLWPSYGPAGCVRPVNSDDFPIRRV